MESMRSARAGVVGLLCACLGAGACGADDASPEQTSAALGAGGTQSASDDATAVTPVTPVLIELPQNLPQQVGGPDAGPAPLPVTFPSSAPAFLNQSCSPQDDADACKDCELNRCCDSRSACERQPACMDYLACMQACPGSLTDCVALCDAGGAQGFALFTARYTCVVARCDAECGGGSTQCAACVINKCGESYVACQLDESCARLELCSSACAVSDQACRDACRLRFPRGTAALDTVQLCEFQNCASSC
jgi:hypothetical protein